MQQWDKSEEEKFGSIQVFFRAPVRPLTGPDIDEIYRCSPKEEIVRKEASLARYKR
jgi:hypothetical protein